MKPFLDRLAAGEVLVSDGAIGTQLIARGMTPGQCPERLNLDDADTLAGIARDYLAAGSELLTTNTFGASVLKLQEYGLEALTEEINQAAVATVRTIAADSAYVSASCGPCGRILEPYGDTAETDVYDGFARQMSALGEADVICIETMSDLREAVLAVRAARDLLPDTPVMAAMTFDPTPRGYFTIMGNSVSDAAAALAEAGADVVGSNCGNGIDRMIEIAAAFAASTDLPILVQSNAGQPIVRGGRVTYSESPETFADRAPDLIDAGVAVVGGCCGTTPEHIRALRDAAAARAVQ